MWSGWLALFSRPLVYQREKSFGPLLAPSSMVGHLTDVEARGREVRIARGSSGLLSEIGCDGSFSLGLGFAQERQFSLQTILNRTGVTFWRSLRAHFALGILMNRTLTCARSSAGTAACAEEEETKAAYTREAHKHFLGFLTHLPRHLNTKVTAPYESSTSIRTGVSSI